DVARLPEQDRRRGMSGERVGQFRPAIDRGDDFVPESFNDRFARRVGPVRFLWRRRRCGPRERREENHSENGASWKHGRILSIGPKTDQKTERLLTIALPQLLELSYGQV